MAIRITDKLYSSTVNGAVADSFSISGGYITVQNSEEKDALNNGPLVKGQPLYVAEEDKTYRWDGTTWNEDEFLNSTIKSHLENKENPHEITKGQLGLGQIDNTSDLDKPISKATQTALDNIESQIVKKIGDQEIKGSLTLVKEEGENNSTGNLVVQGNLIVSGVTITEEHETIRVEDNLIILNSSGNSLGTALSGVAIKTSENDALGIIYDFTADDISLGKGSIDENYNFISNGDSNPVAIRDKNLISGNLIAWDNANKKFIDGGAKPTIETLGGASQTEVEEIKSTLNDQNTLILEIKNDLDTSEENVSNNSKEIESLKSSLGDLNSLPTTNKTVKGAIEETHNSLAVDITKVSENLNVHSQNKINPHEVTIDQLIIRNTAFNSNFEDLNSNIKMDGISSAGSSTTVARADHIHPTDTSRAPATHTTIVASNQALGHVIVDDSISDTSTNPIQNKIIKSYVDNQIIGLNNLYNPVIEDHIEQGTNAKTVTSISQTNGKIKVEYLDIQIEESQVTGLSDSLNDLDSAIQNESAVRLELKASIENEATIRAAQDALILSQMQSAFNNGIAELIKNYNLDLLANFPTDITKKYVLSYNETNSKWEWEELNLEISKA